jgi:DNA transformation protein and related proteins
VKASENSFSAQKCRKIRLDRLKNGFWIVLRLKRDFSKHSPNIIGIMPTPKNADFATYCCELLRSAGPCVAKRMFGGYGISTGGLTIAILTDLGSGEKLWLKGDSLTRGQYEAAGCQIFSYPAKGVARSMNYFSAPEEALDSPEAMRPWAALALDCALRARLAKSTKPPKKVARPRKP